MAERITRLVLQFLDESGYSRAKQVCVNLAVVLCRRDDAMC
jgi:acyl-CoA hydrolase